jgi:hypothetical protein
MFDPLNKDFVIGTIIENIVDSLCIGKKAMEFFDDYDDDIEEYDEYIDDEYEYYEDDDY